MPQTSQAAWHSAVTPRWCWRGTCRVTEKSYFCCLRAASCIVTEPRLFLLGSCYVGFSLYFVDKDISAHWLELVWEILPCILAFGLFCRSLSPLWCVVASHRCMFRVPLAVICFPGHRKGLETPDIWCVWWEQKVIIASFQNLDHFWSLTLQSNNL